MTNQDLIARIAAGAAVAAGVLLSIYTLRTTPERLRILTRKTADLAAVQDMQRQAGADAGAIALFDRLPSGQPPAPADIARDAQLTVPPDVRMRDSQAAPEGWSVRTAEIVWNAVSFVELSRFIQAAEAARPPWRLRECNLTAADSGAEGRARATLIMEALEKKRP